MSSRSALDTLGPNFVTKMFIYEGLKKMRGGNYMSPNGLYYSE
jgi:hypothetical protein